MNNPKTPHFLNEQRSFGTMDFVTILYLVFIGLTMAVIVGAIILTLVVSGMWINLIMPEFGNAEDKYWNAAMKGFDKVWASPSQVEAFALCLVIFCVVALALFALAAVFKFILKKDFSKWLGVGGSVAFLVIFIVGCISIALIPSDEKERILVAGAMAGVLPTKDKISFGKKVLERVKSAKEKDKESKSANIVLPYPELCAVMALSLIGLILGAVVVVLVVFIKPAKLTLILKFL